MATVMTGAELARRCLDIAHNYKTLYVYSCFGSPMTAENKKRYTTNCAYNKKAERTRMIRAASSDTFGFDCVNMIKGVLWGWNGNKNATYGGARYAANGVPDVSANGMIQKCYGVSTSFSRIEVGEVVWMDGHIGVYVGNGLAVECSPKWKNCVQVTAVGNIGSKSGYNTRTWTKHGKMPYVSYTGAAAVVSTPKVANGENPYQYPQGNISYGYSSHHYGAIHTGIEGIKAVQFDLQKLGLYQDAIDGFYGRKTEAAVTQFQRTHKDVNGNPLEADGWAGPLTRGAIRAAVKNLKKTNPYRKPTMVLNRSNAAYGKKYAGWDEVKHIHWGLKELGLYHDAVDGFFGPKTEEAVKQFQRTHKDVNGNPLEVDGSVGPITLAALDKAVS